MNELNKHLWIGDLEDANKESIAPCNAIVSLTNYVRPLNRHSKERPFIQYHIGFSDSERADPDQIRAAMLVTLSLIRKRKIVLVHCAAGKSRAPSMCALILRELNSGSLEFWLDYVKERRHVANPNDGLWSVIKRIKL